MNRRMQLSGVMIALFTSEQMYAQSFGAGNQEMSPRGLALLILAGIFILYKLLGIRL